MNREQPVPHGEDVPLRDQRVVAVVGSRHAGDCPMFRGCGRQWSVAAGGCEIGRCRVGSHVTIVDTYNNGVLTAVAKILFDGKTMGQSSERPP